MSKSFEDVWNLFPSGNKESCKSAYDFLLSHPGITFDGQFATPETLYNHYNNYILWWNSRFKGTEERYIGTKDKKKNLQEFLSSGEYKKTFHVNDTPRDHYLFGDFDRSFILKRVEQFKSKFTNGREQKQTEIFEEQNTEELPDLF